MISNAYSYYLSTYGNKTNSKYDAHKRSDIKNLCGRVQKLNSLTPAYKVDYSQAAQKYAIDLKEMARQLSNVANDLSDKSSDNIIFKKIADSSNTDVAVVSYIGESQDSDSSEFDLEVSQIALPQINTGNYLSPTSKHIYPADYSFDLNISDITYAFEFSVKDNENTLDIQEKLKRLVNRSNIGLKADILTDSLGNTALSIESESTGVVGTRPTIFTITPNAIGYTDGTSDDDKETSPYDSISILGLNRVMQYPTNAVFTVNGEEATSYSNTFSVNHEYEITLKDVSEEPVHISLKPDSESIASSINELVSGYNNLVSVTTSEENEKFTGNNRLRRDFMQISNAYTNLFANTVFDVSDNGSIAIDHEQLSIAAANGSINDVFTNLGRFKNVILQKADDISINPMEYVNNKIISYKNPNRAIMDPYNTSMYSGMMFNGYI